MYVCIYVCMQTAEMKRRFQHHDACIRMYERERVCVCMYVVELGSGFVVGEIELA
jgi:hypothetical protein